MKTREQTILATIARRQGVEWKSLESRAESLPAMLLRHGVLPVKLFLQAKGGSDEVLWGLVESGIAAVLPNVAIGLDDLPQMSFETTTETPPFIQSVYVDLPDGIRRWQRARVSSRLVGSLHRQPLDIRSENRSHSGSIAVGEVRLRASMLLGVPTVSRWGR